MSEAPNLDLSIRAEGGAVARYLAAQDLLALARTESDSLAALAAARMAASVVATPVQRQPEVGAAEVAPPLPTAAAMFDLARAMTLDDDLAHLIEIERSGAHVSAPATVQTSGGTVPADRQDQWALAFYAGSLAEIAIFGPGDAVLDIRITDSAGKLICQQSGPRDRLYCPFVPQQNGRFLVLISNPGPDEIRYTLITN
jgi:hypothetical protein